jgi:hypothetical protein
MTTAWGTPASLRLEYPINICCLLLVKSTDVAGEIPMNFLSHGNLLVNHCGKTSKLKDSHDLS